MPYELGRWQFGDWMVKVHQTDEGIQLSFDLYNPRPMTPADLAAFAMFMVSMYHNAKAREVLETSYFNVRFKEDGETSSYFHLRLNKGEENEATPD